MSTADGANQLLIVGKRKRSPRKLALLNTAIALFESRGYHAVTIRDIGDEMGMTSASLYRHYASKEALLADAIDLVIHPMIEKLEQITSRDVAPSRRLRAAVSFHAGFALTHRNYLRVYYMEARELSAESQAEHQQFRKRYQDLWLDLLVAAGAARNEDEARNLYSMTMAMLNLGSNRSHVPASHERLDWLTERTLAMLIRADT